MLLILPRIFQYSIPTFFIKLQYHHPSPSSLENRPKSDQRINDAKRPGCPGTRSLVSHSSPHFRLAAPSNPAAIHGQCLVRSGVPLLALSSTQPTHTAPPFSHCFPFPSPFRSPSIFPSLAGPVPILTSFIRSVISHVTWLYVCAFYL